MKKILLMACAAMFMASCGTGNDYADAVIDANEKAVSAYEKAESLEDIKDASINLAKDMKDATEKYSDEAKELVKKALLGDEDVKKCQKAIEESAAKVAEAVKEAKDRISE